MAEFNATLKKFQELDVAKLSRQDYSLNANEMGLGKTFEALALDYLYRREIPRGKTLVITPISALWSWEEHVRTIMGLRSSVMQTPSTPQRRAAFLAADADFYIMHPQAIALMPDLKNLPWMHVIADEAHFMCNRNAKVSKAIKKIKSPFRSALTGTPIEERADQMWSILNWLNRKKYSAYWRFFKQYSDYTNETDWGEPLGYTRWLGPKNADELLEEIDPFFVRHLKKERCCPMHPNGAAPEMPSKYYTKMYVDLAPKQRKRYDKMADDQIASLDNDMIMASPITISKLTRLAQFANADCELIHEPHSRCKGLGCGECGYGGIQEKVVMQEPSAKLDAFMEWLPNEPVVVFSQFEQMIRLLEKRCLHSTNPHISFAKITGAVGSAQRRAVIEEFQDGNIHVLGIVDKAGGTGITLTRAKTVVMLDRNASSKTNSQCEDRVHRLGQNNNVQVVDFIARDTVNLQRAAKLQTKADFRKVVLGA